MFNNVVHDLFLLPRMQYFTYKGILFEVNLMKFCYLHTEFFEYFARDSAEGARIDVAQNLFCLLS